LWVFEIEMTNLEVQMTSLSATDCNLEQCQRDLLSSCENSCLSLTPSSLVFIDSEVDDYQSLIKAVQPGYKVFLLQSQQDGVAQITQALQQHSNIEAIHIVSHGSPGCLNLGNSQLSLETLNQYTDHLKLWSGLLGEASILLYGCQVAATKVGQAFLKQLHQLTGVNIAASTKPTGSSTLGGDWNLEVTIGQVRSKLAFTETLKQTYSFIFAQPFNSDDFNTDNTLDSQWTFVNPLNDASYNVTGAGTSNASLELFVPGGTDHNAWESNNAVRVMQPAQDEDFEAEVKFASEPSQKFQIQGLIVEQDDHNWLIFDTYHTGSTLRVYAARTINGSSKAEIGVDVAPGSASYLRVNRSGDTWTLEYSADGNTWKKAGSFTHDLNVNSIGTFGGNADPAPAFTAKVDYFFNTATPILPEDASTKLSINDVSIAEGDSGTKNLTFNVSLSEPSSEVVTVDFSTESGTALEGIDYTAKSGTLSFTPGVTEQTLTVEVQADNTVEAYESFIVNLANATNASIADNWGVGTIEDDDFTANSPLQVRFPDDAGLVNVKDYGARGDGVTDDTEAIQQALAENRTVYFPNGTYLVSDTLQWGDTKRLLLQGESEEKTIIKLKDNLPSFNNAANPKPVITTFEGSSTGQAFQNSIYNLTVDVGAGNSEAIGIRFLNNNQGGIRDVTIQSSDPNNQGQTGLALTKAWPGPALIKNVTVNGFDYGIEVNHPEYSNVFENLTLNNQKIVGINNNGNILNIRGLTSNNSVPVIKNNDYRGILTVIDGNFTGGSSQNSAIELSTGTLYARNINTSGYQSALKKGTTVIPGSSISEYVSSPAYTLFPSPETSLQLSVPELPEIRYDNLSNWASVTDFGAIANDSGDDTAAIQAALNSGKSTVYFPGGRYIISDTLEVGGNVGLITGSSYQTILTINAPLKNKTEPVFRFEPGSQPTVTLERFFGDYGGGSFHWVEQASSTPLTLRNFAIGSGSAYRNSVPGQLVIEDVAASDWVFDQQEVWAWQLNPEGSTTKITNNGGQLWILGLKTERQGTVIETTGGGQTEVLGGLIYPASGGNSIPDEQPAFINHESQLTIAGIGESRYNVGSYDVLVEETRNGVTQTLLNDSNILKRNQGFQIPLYSGFDDGSGNLNQAPLAFDDRVSLDAVEAVVIDVLSNDSDPDGSLDPTSVTINNQPNNGNVSVDPTTGAITYTPNTSFIDNDSFTYLVQDNNGETSNSARVSVSLATNQAPIANNDTASIERGQSVAIEVLANDSDSDGSLEPATVTIVDPPASGEVLPNSNGTLTYTHDGSNTSSDTFTYTVRDDDAALSNVATVNLAIENSPTNMTTFKSDDFNNFTLDPQWTFVNPTGNGSYSLTGAGTGNAILNLAVPSGEYDLWSSNTNAVRVMQPAANTDFQAEVKYTTEPTKRFQTQGILVQQDANNWLRFEIQYGNNGLTIFAANTNNGNTSASFNVSGLTPGSASYLRLTRTGNNWKLDYSGNGENWTTAGNINRSLAVTQIGPYAGNSGPAFSTGVDYFFNTAEPIFPEDALIAGTSGSDSLQGTNGNDIMVGVDSKDATPGQGELDSLTGGTGADIFVLGDTAKVYYNDGVESNAGLGDYALITDFDSTNAQDIIQLHGSSTNYSTGTSPQGLQSGVAIYLNSPQQNELIGIVQGATSLNLNSSSFSFV
jgi:regulation of enolase protein 1 (concanavalin A-like superfamily)